MKAFNRGVREERKDFYGASGSETARHNIARFIGI